MKEVWIHEKIELHKERYEHFDDAPMRYHRHLIRQASYLVQRAMNSIAHHNCKEPRLELVIEVNFLRLKVVVQAPDDFVYAEEPLTTQ